MESTTMEVIMTLVWTCLVKMHLIKNVLFGRFLTSLDSITQFAMDCSLEFAPGLCEVVASPLPPSIAFFKSLPVPKLSQWGIYVIVLKKYGHRPKVYIGSGTSKNGVHARLNQYTNYIINILPVGVVASVENGWSITHKGLLCWIAVPPPGLVPLNRLLFLALEGTFAFVFWAMDSMKHFDTIGKACLWYPTDLEYDGICTHTAFCEGARCAIDLTEEELEAHAAEREKRFRHLKSINASNWHYKQMAENYDEYITASHERVKRSRANNKELRVAYEAKRRKIAVAEKRYHCEECNISVTSKHALDDHYKSPKHKRKLVDNNNPFFCGPCNIGLSNVSNLRRHNGTEAHKGKVAEALAAGQTVHADVYTTYNNRSKEIKSTHLYKCRPCTYSTNESGNWVRHQKSPRHKQKVAVFESTQAATKAAVDADNVDT